MSLPSAELIEAGTSILFLGAGFSAEATNVAGNPIRDVEGLIKLLLDEIGEKPEGYDLDSAADEYVRFFGSKGPEKVTRVLHANFRSKSFSDEQRLIVCQPWYRIYTTNYDDVVETICSEEKKPVTTKEISDLVSQPMPDTTQLIHVYGNITRASADEFKKHFLLTESQRDESPFLRSPWFQRFYDDVLTARSVVFVGFSLNDIDLRRLLGKLPREVLDKVHFVTHPDTPKPIIGRMNKYGRAHPIGLSEFATQLGRKRSGPPIKQYSSVPIQLKELVFTKQQKASVSSRDIEDLMLTGDIDLNKLSHADVSGGAGSYSISRSHHSYSRALNNASGERPILVHSDIGNGKTIFAIQLGYLFSQNNYRVFVVQREPENIGDILNFLQGVEEQVLVIFDDIMRFSRLSSAIVNMRRKDIVVLGTVRTIVLDTNSERVRGRLGNATPIEIDLNSPQRQESLRIVSYLNENGLLGANADWDETEKLNFVETKCGGQLRDVILSLYSKGSLHQRVESLLGNIQALDQFTTKLIGLAALLSYSNFSSSSKFLLVSELVEYPYGVEELRQRLSERELSTLVRLDSGDVIIRSPALALFILTRIFNVESIFQLVKQALFTLDKYFRDDYECVRLGKALLKFSLYGPMLSGKRDNQLIEEFYDDCRVLSFASSDPLFWVQRSICNMHDHHFPISKRFVDTAYGIAKKLRDYDTYQIDNHNARLMLTESLVNGVSADGEREREAMILLKGVLSRKDEDLYHPLSVMRLYADIVDKWRGDLSKQQKASLKKSVDDAVVSLSKFRHSSRFRNLPDLKRRLSETSRRLL